MQSELLLAIENISSEKIKECIKKHPENDVITCLVPQNDATTGALLIEHGFRGAGKREAFGGISDVYKWFRGLAPGYEDMTSFFNRRVRDYDLHMRVREEYVPSLREIVSYIEPCDHEVAVLDLGCGTGAELEFVFDKAPNARVICIDLSEGMLKKLLGDYANHAGNIETVCGSYLEMDFGGGKYDYVIACNTLHHFLEEDKEKLYKNINRALKDNGLLLIDDYFEAEGYEAELKRREQYLGLVKSGAIDRNTLYHIDLPTSLSTEHGLLTSAGFAHIRFDCYKNNFKIVAGVHSL